MTERTRLRRRLKAETRQARFAQEYTIDLSATAAAKRAGFSEKTAYSQGQRLLKNVDVQNEIAQLEAERSERTQIRGDAVLREVNSIARAQLPAELIQINGDGEPVVNLSKQLTKEQLSALAIKLKASELLMRHLGLFEADNRRELTGSFLSVSVSESDLENARRLVRQTIDLPAIEYDKED